MAEWREIETAPKDGTRILLVSVEHEGLHAEHGPTMYPPAVHIGYWNPEGSAWVDECDSFDGDVDHLKKTGVWNSQSGWFQPNEVTHWMPLPPPPTSGWKYVGVDPATGESYSPQTQRDAKEGAHGEE